MTYGREDKQTHLAGACVAAHKVPLCFALWKEWPSKKVPRWGLRDIVVNQLRHFETAAISEPSESFVQKK